MSESYNNTPSSKIRWLCLGEELDEQSESNFEFAAYELSKSVKKLQQIKLLQDSTDEYDSEEKQLRAYKATLLLKAIHNLEEQIKENKKIEEMKLQEEQAKLQNETIELNPVETENNNSNDYENENDNEYQILNEQEQILKRNYKSSSSEDET